MRVWFIQPAFGATLQSFDDAACRKIKGYVRAVRKGNFLAVVATNEWAAISASTSDRRQVVGLGRTTRRVAAFEYVRSSKVDRNEVLQTAGDTAAEVQARQTNAAGDVRLRDAIPTDRSAHPARSPISRTAG